MLILTRRAGEIIRIRPDPTLDPAIPIADLFSTGSIDIVVTQIVGKQVKIGIHADSRLIIVRDELLRE